MERRNLALELLLDARHANSRQHSTHLVNNGFLLFLKLVVDIYWVCRNRKLCWHIAYARAVGPGGRRRTTTRDTTS